MSEALDNLLAAVAGLEPGAEVACPAEQLLAAGMRLAETLPAGRCVAVTVDQIRQLAQLVTPAADLPPPIDPADIFGEPGGVSPPEPTLEE